VVLFTKFTPLVEFRIRDTVLVILHVIEWHFKKGSKFTFILIKISVRTQSDKRIADGVPLRRSLSTQISRFAKRAETQLGHTI